MKLNENDKKEIRKLIEELVEKVPEGQRIHLPKELLENLIFYHAPSPIYGEEDVWLKFPVWTGPFLRKLDLSQVSFDNVLYEPQSYEIFSANTMGYNRYGHILREVVGDGKNYQIDFSYTNARIQVKNDIGRLNIVQTNFEGVDLSHVVLNVSNLFPFCDGPKGYLFTDDCNIRNTGIQITLNPLIYVRGDKFYDNEKYVERITSIIEKRIKCGSLDGCYVDGDLIRDGERVKRDNMMNAENSQFKKIITSEFENQISIFSDESQKSEGKGRK